MTPETYILYGWAFFGRCRGLSCKFSLIARGMEPTSPGGDRTRPEGSGSGRSGSQGQIPAAATGAAARRRVAGSRAN